MTGGGILKWSGGLGLSFCIIAAPLGYYVMQKLPHQDYSTPKSACKSLYYAIVGGSTDAAKAAVTDQKQGEVIAEMKTLIQSIMDARRQAVAKFGEGGKGVSGGLPTLDDIEQGQEQITGDTATVAVRCSSKPLVLKRVNGKWKVDLFSILPINPQDISTTKKLLSAASSAASQVAKRIQSGEFKSAEDANAALKQQMASGALKEMFKGFNIGG